MPEAFSILGTARRAGGRTWRPVRIASSEESWAPGAEPGAVVKASRGSMAQHACAEVRLPSARPGWPAGGNRGPEGGTRAGAVVSLQDTLHTRISELGPTGLAGDGRALCRDPVSVRAGPPQKG